MKEWLLVLKAADAAARWHVHQRRKGPAEEPYINHLIEVAMLVADATGGSDTNLVIAALLHDAIEDSEVPRELIAENFGDDVASIVLEVTDDKSLPKATRKLKQIETAATKSPRAKMLKLADKTSNLRAIAASPPSDWTVKRRKNYVEWAREVAKGLRGVNRKLEEQFEAAAHAAERSFRPATNNQQSADLDKPIRDWEEPILDEALKSLERMKHRLKPSAHDDLDFQTSMIDDPNPYGTLETLERHLRLIESQPPSPLRDQQVAQMHELIAWKRKGR
jgi:hypothetical protein